jgi:hypothetical protein
MQPKLSLFDLAAEKLREAMSSSASGIDRMRLIQEALSLYHLHQREDVEAASGGLQPCAASAREPETVGV